MTIREAIDRIDSLKHNTYSYAEKVLWLSKLDYVIKRQIINTHEGWDKVKFSGYTAKTKDTTKLLVPAPYDEMYIHWLAAQIDYANGEYDRYNNTMAMYQTEYNGYSNYYNRNHMPLGYTMSYSGSEASGSDYPDEEPEEEDPGDDDPDNGGGSYNYAKKEWVEQNFQPKGNYLTEVPEGYAKKEEIPKAPSDIGAQPEGDYALVSQIPSVPVKSVNGKTGAVQLSAADVGARPSNWMPTAQDVGALPATYTPPNQTAQQVGADPKGTAAAAVAGHNTSTDAHGDIRQELQSLTARLNAFFDSDDQTLDELSEIVAYITSNKGLIDAITTSKVSVIDIVNNLTTNVANKPLSAAQGVVLKGLIDTLSTSLSNYALKSAIPTKVSQLQNDSKYLTQHQDISHLLPRTELPTAINTALAQAKASGEFNGYTPQIGVDYWTAADQEAIVQQVKDKLDAPDYVVTEADAVIDRVISAQGNRTFNFAVLTDFHKGRNNYNDDVLHACQATEYIGKRIKLDAVAVLGDYTDLYLDSDYANAIPDYKDVNSLLSYLLFAPNLRQQGNHDFHEMHSPVVHSYVQGFSDSVTWGDKLGGYYYRDFADYKLRVISVNTSETTNNHIGCSDAQYQWFADSLDLSGKEDAAEWQILILSHHPLDWYENAGDGVYRFGHILDAYVNGHSWTGGGISCDYSGKNSARIVGNIHGHLHNLLTGKIHIGNAVQSDEIDVMRMCMPESSAGVGNTYDGVWKEETTYAKTQNTAKDTSATICCIDLDTYTIKAVCYGAGYDRTVVYYDPAKPKYKNQLENAINSDGTPYRGTNGEIGYKVGYRIKSDGSEVANADYCVTGFIPIKPWEYVYLENMNFIIGDSTSQPNTRVAIYDKDFNDFRISTTDTILDSPIFTNLLDENGGEAETGDAIGRLRYSDDQDANEKWYIRFSTKKIDSTSIITINEPIN